MGCSSCQKKKSVFSNQSIVKNLTEAVIQQPNKLKWFKNGVSGIIKCLDSNSIYTDEEIQENRKQCQNCEFSTKNEAGKLNMKSQCMAPDPNNENAPCGCFILCKTQSDSCPIKKFAPKITDITIKQT